MAKSSISAKQNELQKKQKRHRLLRSKRWQLYEQGQNPLKTAVQPI